jgi:cathepsin O
MGSCWCLSTFIFIFRGDVPFYIVKNSWGVEWGINGYLQVAIGSNVCGIAHKVSSILVKI